MAERQRASALRFADPRIHALWHAIIMFRQLAEGFRSADLRRHLAVLTGRDPQAHLPGRHHLPTAPPATARPDRTRACTASDIASPSFGFRAALFFTRLYNRLLRPGLAAALPVLRAVDAPLKRAFDKIDTRSTHGSITPSSPLKLDTFGASVSTQAGLDDKNGCSKDFRSNLITGSLAPR